MLATGAGRRAALDWARTLRGDRTGLMKQFISDATALAAAAPAGDQRARPATRAKTSTCCWRAPQPRAPRCSRREPSARSKTQRPVSAACRVTTGR